MLDELLEQLINEPDETLVTISCAGCSLIIPLERLRYIDECVKMLQFQFKDWEWDGKL